MKVCFETFGCRLNKAEALQQEANFLSKGWTVTEKHSEANLIVVRGCSVTRRAQRDCEKFIDHLKCKYPATKILVVGCMEQSRKATQPAEGNRQLPAANDPIPLRTARAYLKVQDGCSGNCSFCIVPHFRGKSVSLDFDLARDRALRFIDAGYRELVITGCNLSLYASKGHRFAELADMLARLDPSVRVRVGSIEPGKAAEELVKAMTENPQICRFLHLPIQSGSYRVLAAMNRPYLLHEVEQLIDSAITAMPQLGLGCDLMTGFPGESDMDFLSTKGLLERYPFSNVHVFPYSERPNTKAVVLPGSLPRNIRHSRAHTLSKIATSQHLHVAGKFLGREVEILVENADKREGWSGEYLRCRLEPGAPVHRREIIKARVHKLLKGVLIAAAI